MTFLFFLFIFFTVTEEAPEEAPFQLKQQSEQTQIKFVQQKRQFTEGERMQDV